MRTVSISVLVAATVLPTALLAQSKSPVTDAFKDNYSRFQKNLVASAEEMPADKYGYKPTDAQMTFAQVVLHVARDNYEACGPIGGIQAPDVPQLTPSDDKDKLVTRLRDSFKFCDQSFAHLSDSDLGGEVSAFRYKWTRVGLMDERSEDWADHYSQFAIYLRLNGLLPPTARQGS
jgi:hypothetical protein